MKRLRMGRLAWLAVAALAVVGMTLITSCGGGEKGAGVPEPPPGPGPRRITGRITNAANPNQGISNAVVKLFTSRASRQAPVAQTTTDQNGNFSLNANDGDYLLRVDLPDGSYQAVEIGLNVTGNVNINVRLVPREIQIARVEIVVPAGDGPGGSYLVGKTYHFRTKAFDPNGQEITTPLVPNWQVVGGIGTIDADGNFRALSPGTGKIIAIFTVDKRFEANITVSQPPAQNTKPNKPSLIEPQDHAIVPGQPTFRFSASDPDRDRLRYKIEILRNGTPLQTYDQTQNTAGWSKPDYASGETASFIPPTALPAGTYRWLVYAFDGRDWSDASDTRTFTVNNPPTNLTMIAPADNASVDKQPQFQISATDPDGDRLRFKLEILQEGNVIQTYDGSQDPTGWDKTDYASGEVATFTTPQALSLGDYQWRFYAYDGRTWSQPSSTRSFQIRPKAIVVGTSASEPLKNLLIDNGFTTTRIPNIPSDMGDADVLVVDETVDLNTSDAPIIERFLNNGRNIVLIGEVPAMLARGQRLTGRDWVDISPISGWFFGASKIARAASGSVYAHSGLFPLPSGISDGSVIDSISGYRPYLQSIQVGTVVASHWWGRNPMACGYSFPESGARLYWQWWYSSDNPSYAPTVRTFFIAAVKWAAKVPSGRALHWVGRTRRR